MAILYITELSDIADTVRGAVPITKEPVIAEQTVAIGGSSAVSNAFNANTRLVRLHTDAICSIAVGTNPTASAVNRRLAANQTEYIGVPLGGSFKVAVITNT